MIYQNYTLALKGHLINISGTLTCIRLEEKWISLLVIIYEMQVLLEDVGLSVTL